MYCGIRQSNRQALLLAIDSSRAWKFNQTGVYVQHRRAWISVRHGDAGYFYCDLLGLV